MSVPSSGTAAMDEAVRSSFAREARFAVYYAPPADAAWWQIGCAWLGRDPASNTPLPTPSIPGLSKPLTELSATARVYGWHATLSAPFRCRDGIDAADLMAALSTWAAKQAPFMLPVEVAALGRFVAVQPASDTPLAQRATQAIQALAEAVVRLCAPLRAAPSASELAKRRAAGLTERQDALLQAWGYPYVFDQYRFHMTLSDTLDAQDADAIVNWWRARLPALGPLPIDGVALYVQREPGAPFQLWRRIPFAGVAPAAAGGTV